MFLDFRDAVREVLPDSDLADVFCGGNLLVAVAVGEAQPEDALLLCGEVADHELHDVRQPFVLHCLRPVVCCSLSVVSDNRLVTQPLQTLVTDACHQVAFFRAWHQHHLPTKQTFEDVADHIFALLLVVQQGARRPAHLGVVLHEQPSHSLLFHQVFSYNTPQTKKKLTLEVFVSWLDAEKPVTFPLCKGTTSLLYMSQAETFFNILSR